MSVATDSLLFQIKQALARELRSSIRGLQAQPYVMSNPTPPSADIRRGPIEYHQAMGDGLSRMTMLIRVYVAAVTDKGAQALLDAYLSPTGDRSIKEAVEADPSLEGLVSDLIVTGASGEQTYVVEGRAAMLGSEWTVSIWL